MTETLNREVLEETGYTLSCYSNPRMYDMLVQEEGQDFAVHHIMAFYDVVLDLERFSKSLPHEVLDGSNDSAKAIWLNVEEYCRQCFSFSIEGKGGVTRISRIDMTSYRNWQMSFCLRVVEFSILSRGS